jgi:dTDP-4-amino-4,6-dideoxygalactose transaminase
MQPLAIDGGTPVRTAPMPRWPSPGEDELAAVTAVLKTGNLNYWTGGQGRQLESEYASALGRKHAIAVANGSLALELALRAFDIGPGDEVIVPARTFIATAGVVVAVGAVPVIADIEAESSCISAATVGRALTERTRAILPVHLGGWPVDMAPLMELAEKHSLIVIEDCAQAHGGGLAGRPVGNVGSHAGAFSFCQDKILPTGEGGILVLDEDEAYQRAWEYKDHGKSLAKVSDPGFGGAGTSYKWLVDSFGTNWRLDEIAASLARVGLSKLPRWHQERTTNGLRLANGLAGLPGLDIPLPVAEATHAFYRLYGLVEPAALLPGWNRDRILTAIAAEGVPVQYGTCAEIYREEAFARAGLGPTERLPVASRVHETSVAFFVHPTLGADEVDDTIAATRKVFEAAAR